MEIKIDTEVLKAELEKQSILTMIRKDIYLKKVIGISHPTYNKILRNGYVSSVATYKKLQPLLKEE